MPEEGVCWQSPRIRIDSLPEEVVQDAPGHWAVTGNDSEGRSDGELDCGWVCWSTETKSMMSAMARETQTLESLDSMVQQAPVRRELDSIADKLAASLATHRSSTSRLATDRPVPLRCDRTAGNPLELGVRAETEHGFGGRAPSEQHSEGDVLSRIGRHADSARRRMDLEPPGESSGCAAEGTLALDSGGRVASRGDGQRGTGLSFRSTPQRLKN